MSGENVAVVREPIALKARSTRRLEERLALRFPRFVAFFARALWRLPRHPRLRWALLRRVVVTGWEAMNRADFEVVTRGRDERFRTLTHFYAEARELRFEPEELIDLGDDRLLTIGRMRGSGISSGAPFDADWANLVSVSAGLVARDQVFMNRRDALEAAGLSE